MADQTAVGADRTRRASAARQAGKEARYGPLANNPEGDDRFRKDRAVWYEHVTGESLEGLSLTEQWQRVDVLARGWRAYSDGRSAKHGPKCVECGCNPCECAPPEAEPEYVYDDY